MSKKVIKTSDITEDKDYFARKNYACNRWIVAIAGLSFLTYLIGNLISLYNYFETKQQNEIAISSDLYIPSILYHGTINNEDSIYDYLFHKKPTQDKNIVDTSGFVVDRFTVCNNGSYNASDVQIELTINREALDYLTQFIKDKNLNLEVSYQEVASSIDLNDKNNCFISIQQKYKNSYQSRLITTSAGRIQNIKKDSEVTIDIPSNLDFFIKFSAYLKAAYNDSFDIKDLQNPILIKIKSFGRGNKEIFKTVKAHLSDIILYSTNKTGTKYFAIMLIDH